jgi:hypothetical protein
MGGQLLAAARLHSSQNRSVVLSRPYGKALRYFFDYLATEGALACPAGLTVGSWTNTLPG